MKAESRQIPQKLAARLKFAYCFANAFNSYSTKCSFDNSSTKKFDQVSKQHKILKCNNKSDPLQKQEVMLTKHMPGRTTA